MDSICEPTFSSRDSGVPQPATSLARIMERPEKNMLWMETGKPIFKISAQALH